MASSPSNDQDHARVIAEALTREEVGGPESAAARPEADLADAKQVFCENWDTVKRVLMILRKLGPAFIRPLIDIIVKAGDTLHGVLCR